LLLGVWIKERNEKRKAAEQLLGGNVHVISNNDESLAATEQPKVKSE